MEMEMDMDELELLEANYRLYEEDCTEHEPPEQPYPEPEEEEEDQLPTGPTSPPSTDHHQSTETQINGQKRSRPVDESAEAPKRSRIEDEDWLRYSPPPPHQSEDPIIIVEETRAPEKLVSRYASEIDGDFIPVTAPGLGDRVYAKISRVEQPSERGRSQSAGGLISEPIHVLMQRLEQEAFTRALQASSRGQSDVILPETPVVHERLWVDKYAPNSFTELLSDEQTNREVLLWLKQWDSCVFGSEIRSTTDEVMSALKRHKLPESKFPRSNRGSRWNNEKFKHVHVNGRIHENTNLMSVQDLSSKSRTTGPPEHKILLLCGPPGLGKTTLAHVAAKHCGYRVVEVNASDERSSSTIGAKILDVVQMNSVSADSRPKCLVIDEIDGALGDGKGAVEVILKMVSADKKSDMEKENVDRELTSGKASSKKKRKSAALTRPIICICNDLYAPSLRPLRQIAKVHVFVQPTVSRVVSRLKYICNKEGMKTSSIALTVLAEHTECDIRSCLNTLQFLNKKKEALNAEFCMRFRLMYCEKDTISLLVLLKQLDIGSQVVGRKDMSVGVFDVWKEIFQKRKPKRQQRTDSSCGMMSNEFDSLYSLVSHRGDYDLIVDGVHENVLHLPYHDPVMQKTVKCLNSLGVSDLMNKYIMRTQHMALYAYQPVISIIVHRLVAQVQRPNIEWPKSYHRYRTVLVEKVDSLRSWYNTIPPSISRHLSVKSFVEDSISLLLHILSPPALRLAALHLLSEKEKNDLAQLVSTMVSYSITHRRIKSDPVPGNLNFQAADVSELSFDPPINSFINFQGYRSGHHVLASAMKQMLAHEVEKQRILQARIGSSEHLTDGYKKENDASLGLETRRLQSSRADQLGASATNNGKSESMSNRTQSNPSTSGALPNLGPGSNPAITKLNSPGCMRKSSSGSSSFFDRFRKLGKGSQNTADAVRKEATSERDSRPLVFKFNEGFTNAVKRPVRVREFLT